jgi:hypothetical protein
VLEIIRRTSTVDQYQREGKRPGEPHPHDAARSPSLQQRDRHPRQRDGVPPRVTRCPPRRDEAQQNYQDELNSSTEKSTVY